MTKTTTQTTRIAARQAMMQRTRFSFGRSFMNALKTGAGHRDVGKLSAFLVAAGVTTPKQLQTMAAKNKLSAQVLNDVAIGVVTLTPAAELPVRFKL